MQNVFDYLFLSGAISSISDWSIPKTFKHRWHVLESSVLCNSWWVRWLIFGLASRTFRSTFHDKTGSKREIETTHSKIDSVRCLIFTWAGAQILSDLMHTAYPAISPTTGSLYHSPSPPGCLPHVCWLYDNKNRDFVSFPTLDYLNCNTRQWICFMAEGETLGGGEAVNAGIQNAGGGGGDF